MNALDVEIYGANSVTSPGSFPDISQRDIQRMTPKAVAEKLVV